VVGVGHRRQVGLGLDAEIERAAARQTDRVGEVGELERDPRSVVDTPRA
jgi:hypothetical protein